jgi:hypothetical protein
MTRSQTPHIYNRQEASPYNEINLDLSYSYEEGVPTIEAKGILIAENTYLSNPNRFLNVLRSAKKLNIPIFIQPS